MKSFKSFWIFTVFALIAGPWIGYAFTHTAAGAFSAFFVTFVLGMLEASLSVDNAVVNAAILRKMRPIWRKRFLTWGMVVAVFGMRIVFPLVLVSVLGHMSPWRALTLAIAKPRDYATVMGGAHVPLAGFGATFLLLVSLRFFFDTSKRVHWLGGVERVLSRLGRLKIAEYLVAAPIVFGVQWRLHEPSEFLLAAAAGAVTFFLMHLLNHWAQNLGEDTSHARSGLAFFVYLEVLDASFSLDGVVGAFAITENLFLIALGLGLGAMFVRSLTIWLVDKGALEELRYLEHGAFYAIGALAVALLVDLYTPLPEAVTGLVGAMIIGGSIVSSLRHRRRTRTT